MIQFDVKNYMDITEPFGWTHKNIADDLAQPASDINQKLWSLR